MLLIHRCSRVWVLGGVSFAVAWFYLCLRERRAHTAVKTHDMITSCFCCGSPLHAILARSPTHTPAQKADGEAGRNPALLAASAGCSYLCCWCDFTPAAFFAYLLSILDTELVASADARQQAAHATHAPCIAHHHPNLAFSPPLAVANLPPRLRNLNLIARVRVRVRVAVGLLGASSI